MSGKQNNLRRKNFLQGRWTVSECQRFLKGYESCGKNWMEVQKYVKTRNLSQIRSHAQKIFLRREDHGLDPESSFLNSEEISYQEFSDNQNQLLSSFTNKRNSIKRPKLSKKSSQKMKESELNFQQEAKVCRFSNENKSEVKESFLPVHSFSLPSQEEMSKYISRSSSPSRFMQIIEKLWYYFSRGGTFLELQEFNLIKN